MTAPTPTVSVSQWTLREPDTARSLDRIAAAGYDAIEVGGSSPTSPADATAIAASGLAVTSICPLLGAAHDLAADDAGMRRAASEELRRWADVARTLGADVVIVVPSDRPTALTWRPKAELLARCADALNNAVDGPDGPTFVVEALNRYETHLVRTLADARELRDLVGSPRVALMADTFHASIEEDSPLQAVRDHASHLRHVHLADNQRRGPGSGSFDFATLLADLDRAGYTGALTMEFLPADDDALRRARRHVANLLTSLAGGQP